MMKKIVVLHLFMYGIAATYTMQQGDAPLTQSTDWEFIMPLQKPTEQIVTPPIVVICHGTIPDLIPSHDNVEQETEDDTQNVLDQDAFDDTSGELDNAQSRYRIPPLTSLYQTFLTGITNQSWYQDKRICYSLFAGTGTFTLGALGYWYLHKK